MDGNSKLAAARVYAQAKAPYLAVAIMKLLFRPSGAISTCGVNRHFIMFYSEDFVQEMSTSCLGVVMIHEVWHLLMGHPKQVDGLISKYSKYDENQVRGVANVAQDAAINQNLTQLFEEVDFGKFPPIVPNIIGEPPGLHSVEYFERMFRDPSKRKKYGNPSDGYPMGGSSLPGDLDNEDGGRPVTEASTESVRVSVGESMRNSGIGKMPAQFQEWVDGLLNPKVSWERELAASVSSGVDRVRGHDDYSYSRRSRRYQSWDIIYPGLVDYSPSIGVVVDTSCSMNRDDLRRCMSELDSLTRVHSGSINVAAIDTEVQWEGTVENAQGIELKGRGGTDMGAGIEWAKKKNVDILIIMTDGGSPWPEKISVVRHPIILLVGGMYGAYLPQDAKVIRVS